VLSGTVDALRLGGSIMLDFPDDGRGWVTRATAAARALIRKSAFDVVVTSGPPHTAHFAGMLATMGTRVPHVIDMRDPWRMMSPEWSGHPARWRLLERLEGVMFRSTRHVVVNTREFADRLRIERPHLAVSLVSNGTDTESLPVRTNDLFDGVSLVYAGTVYIGRTFVTLLAAMESLRRDRPAAAACVKLRIAGEIGATQLEQLRAELTRRRIEDMVELHGSLPRPAALELLRRSHLALVLAQAQPTQVPAKLYECVGLGVPTLVISESDSAASHEARRIGGLVATPDDSAGVRRLLDDLVDGRVPRIISPTAPISYEGLASQMDELLQRVAVPTR
jgi:glycosyltransferase involved in cell wall biosynthesis